MQFCSSSPSLPYLPYFPLTFPFYFPSLSLPQFPIFLFPYLSLSLPLFLSLPIHFPPFPLPPFPIPSPLFRCYFFPFPLIFPLLPFFPLLPPFSFPFPCTFFYPFSLHFPPPFFFFFHPPSYPVSFPSPPLGSWGIFINPVTSAISTNYDSLKQKLNLL